eukprot:577712-Rhodomonas_salina.1
MGEWGAGLAGCALSVCYISLSKFASATSISLAGCMPDARYALSLSLSSVVCVLFPTRWASLARAIPTRYSGSAESIVLSEQNAPRASAEMKAGCVAGNMNKVLSIVAGAFVFRNPLSLLQAKHPTSPRTFATRTVVVRCCRWTHPPSAFHACTA